MDENTGKKTPFIGHSSSSITPINSPNIGNRCIASTSGTLNPSQKKIKNELISTSILDHTSPSNTPINSPIIGKRCIASSNGYLNPSQKKRKNELISTNSPLFGRKSPSISLNNSPRFGNWNVASSSGSLKSLDENTGKKTPFIGHSSSNTPSNSPNIGNRCIASASGTMNPSLNMAISTNSPLLGHHASPKKKGYLLSKNRKSPFESKIANNRKPNDDYQFKV